MPAKQKKHLGVQRHPSNFMIHFAEASAANQPYVRVERNNFYTVNNFRICLRPKLSTKSCFIKQKCQIQMGISKYENLATPRSTRGINTTHQHFQMRYVTLFLLKGLKSCFTMETPHLEFDG